MDFAPVPSPFTPRLPHAPLPASTTTNTLGLLTTHLLPSLTIHTSLSLLAYSAGRFTNRLDSKDLLWPSAFVANAWYHGVIHPYMIASPRARSGVWECIKDMGYTQKLVLYGVTVWGVRLFIKVFMRVKGRSGDDARYAKYRKTAEETVRDNKRRRRERAVSVGEVDLEKGLGREEKIGDGDAGEVDREMWNKAFLGIFLPEGIVQSFVSLGWSVVRYSRPVIVSPTVTVTGHSAMASAVNTAPVTVLAGSAAESHSWRTWVHAIAIGTFAVGLALEMIADSQLKRGKRRRQDNGEEFDGLVRDGVWSIVRHPKYVLSLSIHTPSQEFEDLKTNRRS